MEILRYLEGIDATLAPFGGKYIMHGGKPEVLEGSWKGDLVIISFPDMQSARAWYHSPAYRDIRPLRVDNSEGDVLLVEGVGVGHRATDILAPG